MPTRERPATPVKERALRLLSVRSRSRTELMHRLRRAGYESEEIEEALSDLERVGLIDDERFAREVAEDRRKRGYGPRAGMAALRQKGVDRAVAERVVEESQPEDEEDRAAEVARARWPRLSNLEPPVARRRLLDFLLRRGFDFQVARDACRRVIEEGDGPDEDEPA
ncbi:MAG: recombination regulator RecX [Actinomycetota bacterium]|nr:recombination regulator RecX [Actinomycetota bacterium]